MQVTRRQAIAMMGMAAGSMASQKTDRGVIRYVRFRYGNVVRYGILEGEEIREIDQPPFFDYKETGQSYKLRDVKLLYPCEPTKVLAVGLNYRSHLGNRPVPKRPEIFYKPISCLQNPEDPIIIPRDAKNVHFEGELVGVIGKRARKVSEEEAEREILFGVTCGNDVSERDWQHGPEKDLQWWRAKGADTFGPMGPCIVRGLNYGDLLLTTRVNGKVKQRQRTSDLIFPLPKIISFVSQYVTLEPGDVIFTGTPGTTEALKPGDIVEVEVEGIGVLRNPVVKEK